MEIFSEHLKRDHVLTRIDARVKLLVSLVVLALVLSCRDSVFPLFVISLALSFCLALRIPPRVLLLRFSEPMVIALVLVAIKTLFSGEDVLFSVDLSVMTLQAHRDGLMEGLGIASRIAGAVSVLVVLGFMMTFTEFMSGLAWFRVPRGLVEILLFAYRYIFVLIEDALVIYQAQKNRLGYASIRRGLASFGILAGSLVLRAYDHSENTTVAMVQRGYDGTIPTLKHKPFSPSEIVLSSLFVAALALVWNL